MKLEFKPRIFFLLWSEILYVWKVNEKKHHIIINSFRFQLLCILFIFLGYIVQQRVRVMNNHRSFDRLLLIPIHSFKYDFENKKCIFKANQVISSMLRQLLTQQCVQRHSEIKFRFHEKQLKWAIYFFLNLDFKFFMCGFFKLKKCRLK